MDEARVPIRNNGSSLSGLELVLMRSNGSRRHHITRVKMDLQSDVFAPFLNELALC